MLSMVNGYEFDCEAMKIIVDISLNPYSDRMRIMEINVYSISFECGMDKKWISEIPRRKTSSGRLNEKEICHFYGIGPDRNSTTHLIAAGYIGIFDKNPVWEVFSWSFFVCVDVMMPFAFLRFGISQYLDITISAIHFERRGRRRRETKIDE